MAETEFLGESGGATPPDSPAAPGTGDSPAESTAPGVAPPTAPDAVSPEVPDSLAESSAPGTSPLSITPGTWPSLDSVTVPQPEMAPHESVPHPFDAHAHWQVWTLSAGILAVFAAAVAGWWEAASGGLVVLLLLMVGWRVTNRRSWIRARGTVFDVSVLLAAAGAIAALVAVLSVTH